MTIATRILMASLAAVCVLGSGSAQAQESKSNTKVTINDDGKRRHIVVERDGKVIKDEWVDSKGSKNYTITTDKNGEIHIQAADGNMFVPFGGKDGVRYITPGQGGLFQLDKDGKTRIVQGGKGTTVFGQGGKFERITPGKGTTVFGGKDGATTFRYVPGAQGTWKVDTSGKGPITLKRNGEGYNIVGGRGGTLFGGNDLSGLLKSLTREQRRKQNSRGYLTLDDLTPAQRRMFNAPKGGDWNIVYQVDGDKIILRGK